MLNALDLPRRARATGIHLSFSLAVAALAAALVFGLWYPGPYRHLAGGQELFWLVVSVDVVLGPLLTFAVFNIRKGWPHLRRDLAVICLLQAAALVYGLQTVYAARPVATVFEVDRLRVLTALDVSVDELPKARPEYRKLPLTGPWLLGTRTPRDADENNDALFVALETGVDRGQRPQFWQPYSESLPEVVQRARPLAALVARNPGLRNEIRTALAEARVDEPAAKFLPVVARGGDWVALLAASGHPIHYLRADGFF